MPSKEAIPHILQLTPKEQKKFLDSFDVVFSDCDGVVWMIVGPIPGSGTGVKALQETGKRVVFVSNNSLRTDEEYQAKLKAIGANPVEKENLLHPVKVITRYLKDHRPDERIFSICSSVANEYLQSHGVALETMKVGKEILPSEVPQLLQVERSVGAVVLDININLTYIEIAKACEYLKQKDCIFVTGGIDSHMPVTTTLTVPGFETPIKQISEFTSKEAIMLGKPSRALADYMKKIFNITQPKRCLFIGDSLKQDVGFGKLCGFQTVFVASTGTYSKDDMLAAPEEHQPDYYCDGIADFADLVKRAQCVE